MRRRWNPIVTTLIAGLALSACGGTSTTGTGSAEDVNWIQYQPQGTGGDMAQITGEIVEVDGCLAIHNDELGDKPTFLAFSSESALPASLQVGQEFSGSGGWSSLGTDAAASEWTIPDSCSDASLAWIVNAS